MVEAGREPMSISRVMRWMEEPPLTGAGWRAATIGMLTIFGAAWLARVAIDDALPPGFPYVTFFPAIVLTSVLFGARQGAFSALLSGLVAWYYFVPPVHSFQLEGAEAALALYLFVVATDLVFIYGMQSANRQLRIEREISRDLAETKELMVRQLEDRVAESRRVADALSESEVKTQLATQTAGIGLWQWHIASGQVRWDNTMFALYGLPPTADGLVHYADYLASLHPADAADQDRMLRETVENCAESTREFRIVRGDDGSLRHIRAVEVARLGPDGKTEWVVGTNLDITEQKSRESHVQMLLGEVNHRAKNLLAVVLSVARRTSGADHATFMENFAARIHSLAAGQDLLVESEWKQVGINALVRAQLGHFKDLIGGRITLSGDDVPLSSSAVQAIGMAIHELVTNASKYGALSNESGRIALTWSRSGDEAGERFVMTWTESGGPPVARPLQSGFGSIVTGDMVRTSLDAEVESEFARTGLIWRLECPIDSLGGRETI